MLEFIFSASSKSCTNKELKRCPTSGIGSLGIDIQSKSETRPVAKIRITGWTTSQLWCIRSSVSFKDSSMGNVLLNRTSMSILLIIAFAVWGGLLWVLGIELTWEHASPYSLTLLAITSCIWLFDRCLWKNWPIQKLIRRPDLNGSWRVSLQSTYKQAGTEDLVDEVNGFAVVRQTFSSISIRILTEQAESSLVASSFDLQTDGTIFVYGVYQNVPSIHLRVGDSEIHYGSFRYKVIGRPPYQICGHYWTDRNTKGSISLVDRKNVFFDSYIEAKNSWNAYYT